MRLTDGIQILGSGNWSPVPRSTWEEPNAQLIARRFVSPFRRKTHFHEIDGAWSWHAMKNRLRRVMPTRVFQTPATEWFVGKYIKEPIEHGTKSVFMTDPIALFVVHSCHSKSMRGTPGLSTNAASFAFSNRLHCRDVYHLGYSGNSYRIEIDGLLASGRGLRTGRQARYFSALPFVTHTFVTRPINGLGRLV